MERGRRGGRERECERECSENECSGEGALGSALLRALSLPLLLPCVRASPILMTHLPQMEQWWALSGLWLSHLLHLRVQPAG